MSAAPRHFTSPSAASEPLPCYIDGEPYKTSSTFEVLDPNDNTKVLRKVYGASVDEARMAVEAAARAFPGAYYLNFWRIFWLNIYAIPLYFTLRHTALHGSCHTSLSLEGHLHLRETVDLPESG